MDGLPGYQLYSEISEPLLWSEWLDRYNLSGEQAGPGLDLDKDGLAAVMEYLLDTSPVSAQPMPVWFINLDGATPSLVVSLRTLHPEWSVSAQSSADLQTWSSAPLEPLAIAAGPGMTRHAVPIDPVNAPFVRLTINPSTNE